MSSYLNAYNAPHWMQLFAKGPVAGGKVNDPNMPGWYSTQVFSGVNDVEIYGTSWTYDLMKAKNYAPVDFTGNRTLRFNGTTDANMGYTPGGHLTHDLGMAMDMGIKDYVNEYYQGTYGLKHTPAIVIPAGTPKGWDNARALSLSGLLEREVEGNLSTNNQREATRDFLSLYWTTKNDLKQLDTNGQPGTAWVIVNGRNETEKRQIQTDLFRGAGAGLSADPDVSLISSLYIGEPGFNTYEKTIRKVLDQLSIQNKAEHGNHRNHFHIYLKPPAPDVLDPAKPLLAQAETRLPAGKTLSDVTDMAPLWLAEATQARKYDKIVDNCTFARTYEPDMDEPVLVAKGQYAKNYEENVKLRAVKVEILRQPKHGEVSLNRGSLDNSGRYPPGFGMKSTDNYLGPDLVEYAVELSNGKRVLVRSHIYWVNLEAVLDRQCPPSAQDYRDMRRIQKEHPEYFRKLNGLDPLRLPADALSWLQQIERESLLAEIYNQGLVLADLPGTTLAQTTGEAPNATLTLDPTAAGHGWFVDSTPQDNSEYLPTSNPNQWIAKAGTEAANKLDLLSVLLHEYGHALGIAHSADGNDYMAATLQPGVRRLPSSDELALMAQLAGQARLALDGNTPDAPNPALPLGTLGFALLGRLRRTDYGAWTVQAESAQLLPQYQIAINPTLSPLPNPLPLAGEGANVAASGGMDLSAWQANGNVEFDGAGQAILGESATAQAHLAQGFVINPGDRTLSFTVKNDLQTNGNSGWGPQDAFEVALLNANTGEALAGTDSLATDEDTPVTLAPLANDLLQSGEPPALEVTHQPAHGILTQNGDGTLSYQPDANWRICRV